MENVLKKLIGISLLITLIYGTTGCTSTSTTKKSSTSSTIAYQSLKVGVGQAAINLPSSYFPEDRYTGVHDTIYTKTLILDNGDSKIVIVDVDLTSLGTDQLSDKKEIISRIAGVNASNIIICASHTFSTTPIYPASFVKDPNEKVKNDTMKNAVNDSITNSVEAAVKNIQLAKVGYGTGISNVNVNRDILTSQGYGLGSNERGTSDKAVDVVKFEDLKGNAIAVLSNYAVQSSVMSDSVMNNGGKLISADLGGAANNYVKQQYKGAIAMFTTGAAGDQSPIFTSNSTTTDITGKTSTTDLHDSGFDLLNLLGKRLGGEIISTSQSIKSTQTNIPIRIVRSSVECQGQAKSESITIASQPTKKYTYKSASDVECPIEIIQIGDIYIIGVPTELGSQIGLNIKKSSPFKNTIVMTMCDGAQKYMADSKSYDNFTYEAKNSDFTKGSAEKVEAKIQSMLNQLK